MQKNYDLVQALKHKHLKDISSLYMFLSSLKCLLKARQGGGYKIESCKIYGAGGEKMVFNRSTLSLFLWAMTGRASWRDNL